MHPPLAVLFVRGISAFTFPKTSPLIDLLLPILEFSSSI